MNPKIKILAGVVSMGIITGISFGYYTINNKNTNLNIVLKQETILASVSDEDMASTASTIIKGKVISISDSKWNTPDGKQPSSALKFEDMQYKEVMIKPDYVFKGNAKNNSIVKVKVYGGTYEEEGQKYEVMQDVAPQFSKDENVIVFLGEDDTPYNKNKSNDYFLVFGQHQGKYTVNRDEVQSAIRKLSKKDLDTKINNFKDTESKIKKGSGKI